jgi:hypothetical protein
VDAVKGIYKNGQVILDERANWPDGSRVLVEPMQAEDTWGIREEDWPTSPEEVARHLALMDRIQPLDMTPAEQAEWQAARKIQKDYETETFGERSGQIEGLFP